jgi:uncharacterized protein YjbI with pentapeptide repeats
LTRTSLHDADLRSANLNHADLYGPDLGGEPLARQARDANLSGANQMEITNARAREEHQKRQMLFPITTAPFAHIQEWRLFDADRQTDWASELREYFIPDFSNWMDHDSYQRLSTGCCAI